jgi:hypothetical protein
MMMGRLMVMVGGGVMMGCRLMVMLAGRMFLSFRHGASPPKPVVVIVAGCRLMCTHLLFVARFLAFPRRDAPSCHNLGYHHPRALRGWQLASKRRAIPVHHPRSRHQISSDWVPRGLRRQRRCVHRDFGRERHRGSLSQPPRLA